MKSIIDRYEDDILGSISCFDRIIIKGTLPTICYAEGITKYLNSKKIKIFNYVKEFAEPLRKEIRATAGKIAKENNIEIEHISKSNIRKEEIIKKKIQERGNKPGMVHIISVMETCHKYYPCYDKETQYPKLKMMSGKCIHYYYYFIDEQLGLCYVRVPTWCPFQLQIYFNGHNWLAKELDKANITYKRLDNAFVEISNYKKAQEISDSLNGDIIKGILDSFAEKYCPIITQLPQKYYWSLSQVEYATDIIFKEQKTLKPIYDNIIKTSITAVKPENIATFLSRKLDKKYQQEVGNNYNVRIYGTRIKHSMGKSSIKMYDKYGHILRIETSTNDISFFKHYREVKKNNGEIIKKEAKMRKNIYSITPLQEKMIASNTRYLKYISSFDDNSVSVNKITELSEKKKITQLLIVVLIFLTMKIS